MSYLSGNADSVRWVREHRMWIRRGVFYSPRNVIVLQRLPFVCVLSGRCGECQPSCRHLLADHQRVQPRGKCFLRSVQNHRWGIGICGRVDLREAFFHRCHFLFAPVPFWWRHGTADGRLVASVRFVAAQRGLYRFLERMRWQLDWRTNRQAEKKNKNCGFSIRLFLIPSPLHPFPFFFSHLPHQNRN